MKTSTFLGALLSATPAIAAAVSSRNGNGQPAPGVVGCTVFYGQLSTPISGFFYEAKNLPYGTGEKTILPDANMNLITFYKDSHACPENNTIRVFVQSTSLLHDIRFRLDEPAKSVTARSDSTTPEHPAVDETTFFVVPTAKDPTAPEWCYVESKLVLSNKVLVSMP